MCLPCNIRATIASMICCFQITWVTRGIVSALVGTLKTLRCGGSRTESERVLYSSYNVCVDTRVGSSAWSRRVGSNGDIAMEKRFFLKCRIVRKCERARRWRGIKWWDIRLSRLTVAWKCVIYQARLHCRRKTLQTRRVLSSESRSSALSMNSLWGLNYISSNLQRHTIEAAAGGHAADADGRCMRTTFRCNWCWKKKDCGGVSAAD